MSSEISNVQQVIVGIINATQNLSASCGKIKYEPKDLPELITKLSQANIDIDYKKFIDGHKALNDPLSAQLLLYWCWWAYAAYYEPSVLVKLLPEKETFTYANFNTNLPGQPFFFVTIDHFSKSIVISIRGTYSLSDGITDAAGIMIPFLPDIEILAHTGFVTGAQNVLTHLDTILPKYLELYPNYPIKVVGHSYGAAVTSIVCSVLEMNRQMGKLNTSSPIRSFNFCCPPVYNMVGTIKVCNAGNQISIVLGWDVVPRASLNNVQLFLCEREPELSKYSYVPGTILWITYDDNTETLENIYNIEPANPALMNLNLHPNMGNDHLLSRVYGYLLAFVTSFTK
jgi:hypothetical protein